MIDTYSYTTGQIGNPIQVNPNTKITVSGSGYIEYIEGDLQNAKNNPSLWAEWPLGSASGSQIVINTITIRAIATGSFTVTIETGIFNQNESTEHFSNYVEYVTNSNGSVSLVVPDGVISLNKRTASRGITLSECSTHVGSTLVGAGVTAETVAVNIPGYKVGNSIRFTIPVGVTGSITFPVFTARNIKNGVFGIVFDQKSLDVGRAGAVYFGDTSAFTTNAYRADPIMNRFGLQAWSWGNNATYSINEMAVNAGTPTPQTVAYAKLLVNNTAGSVPWVADIHEIFAGASTTPMVSMIFDDGIESGYFEALPVLNNYGLKAAFGIIKDLIGDSGYMTEAMLNKLYGDGHEIAPHGQYSLATFGSVALALADIDSNKAYLDGLGFVRGSDYYIYPNGVFDYSSTDRTSIIDYLQSIGMRAGYAYGQYHGGGGYGILPIRKNGQFQLPRLPVKATSVAATILNQVDALVSTGRSVVLNLHDIVASGASGDATNRAVFEDICLGLATRQASGTLKVVAPSEQNDMLGL